MCRRITVSTVAMVLSFVGMIKCYQALKEDFSPIGSHEGFVLQLWRWPIFGEWPVLVNAAVEAVPHL